jgi:aminoglycoside 6'-N-acetyltransferase
VQVRFLPGPLPARHSWRAFVLLRGLLLRFHFRPLTESDLPLLERWLAMPHVKQFWDDGPWLEVRAKYLERIGSDAVRQFIVLLEGAPIGYAQWYEASLSDPTTIGIDQFIGEPDLIGQGVGTELVRALLDTILVDQRVRRVVVDPAAENRRAIRCYEKVGFKPIDPIDSPTDAVLLMELFARNPNARQ